MRAYLPESSFQVGIQLLIISVSSTCLHLVSGEILKAVVSDKLNPMTRQPDLLDLSLPDK